MGTVHSFRPSAATTLLHLAHDPINEAAMQMGAARIAMREFAIDTNDAADAYRATRVIELEIQALETTRALIHLRACALAGHEV